jgi:Flp pilus assembly protein TadD
MAEANKYIFASTSSETMKLILTAFVLLLLTGQAYCQLTAANWAYKGAALENQGQYDAAIKAFDEAIKLDPNDAMAWNNKGAALEALGKTTEANAAFAKAKELGYTG